MPNKEFLQTITAREAFARIADVIEKQRGPKEEDNDKVGKLGLRPAMQTLLDVFDIENVRIPVNIFTASEVLPRLPEIYINEVKREMSINGRLVKFHTKPAGCNRSYWEVLLHFVSNANTNIDKSALREIFSRAGLVIKDASIQNCISYLRKRLGDDPYSPKIITTDGSKSKKTYRFNADVHITDKPLSSDGSDVSRSRFVAENKSKNRAPPASLREVKLPSVKTEEAITVKKSKRVIAPVAKETSLPGRGTSASSEESLDKPPALAVDQVAALAIILQGKAYKQRLQKYGININGAQLETIKNIVSACRRTKVGGIYTESFLKQSFPLLVQYLKGFVGGDRSEYLDSNESQGKKLLDMIPGTITVDKLEPLMAEIEIIINEPFHGGPQIIYKAR